MKHHKVSSSHYLGFSQARFFYVLLAGAIILPFIALFLLAPIQPPRWWDYSEEQIENIIAPLLQYQLGFKAGLVTYVFKDGSRGENYTITHVSQDGILHAMGFRPGDIPFHHHSGGHFAFYEALMASRMGEEGDLTILRPRRAELAAIEKERTPPRARAVWDTRTSQPFELKDYGWETIAIPSLGYENGRYLVKPIRPNGKRRNYS